MRLGGEGVHSKLFVNLSTEVQDSITNDIDFGNETPVITYIEGEYIIVISSEAFYIKDNNVWQKLMFKDCTRVDLVPAGPDYLCNLMIKKRTRLDELILTNTHGKDLVLRIDEESTHFNALYQTLYFAVGTTK